jgi:thiosulfate/3-mercaptopyruvate sulfurtransferase
MSYTNPEALVSTEWLEQHLRAPDVRIVDATWVFPDSDRDAAAEYKARHIPSAVRFDIDDIADTSNPLPHMLPGPEKFSSRMRKLGLGDGSRIVVYDADGLFAAPRAWWMFRVFGHSDVAVLDGGLAKWVAEDRPTDDRPPAPRERHFTARVNRFLVRTLEQVRTSLEAKRHQIIDARSPGRFAGNEPERRQMLRAGHIPGSCNLPYADLYDAEENTLLPAERLARVFTEAGVEIGAPTIATCGSGVSACNLALAFYLLGNRNVAVYDGSWTEWGSREDTLVEG